MNMSGRNPLETLVVAELAELRKRELALQTYFNSGTEDEPTHDASAFQLELDQLRNHTDRLGRMMDAMSLFFSSGVNEALVPIPAL